MKTSGGTYLRTLQQIRQLQEKVDSGQIGTGGNSLIDEQTAQQLLGLNSTVQLHSNQIQSLTTKQNQDETNITTLQGQVTNINDQIGDNFITLNNAVSGLSLTQQTHSQDLQNLNTAVSGLTNTVSQNSSSLTTLNNAVSGLTNTQQTHTQDLQSLNTAVTGLVNTQSNQGTQISTLNSQQTVQDTNISNLRSDLTSTQNLVSNLQITQTSQGTQITTNTNDISTIKTQQTQQDTNITNLQTTQTSQGTQITTNTNDISTIKTQQTSQDTLISGHTTSINTNTNNITNLQSSQSSQDTLISGHTTNINTLISQMASTGSTSSGLQIQITQAVSQINSLIAGTTSYASLHVNQTSGNDLTGDGSLTKPFASIQACLTSFTPGSPKTIYVHSPHSSDVNFRTNDQSLMIIMDPKITVSSNISYVANNQSIYWVGQQSQMTGTINDNSSAGMIAYDTIFTGTYNKNATISGSTPQGYVEFTSRSNVDNMILNLTCNSTVRFLGTGNMGAITQTNGFLTLQHSGSINGIGKPAIQIASPYVGVGQIPITLIQGQIQLVTDQTNALVSTASYGYLYLTQLSTVQFDLTTYKQINCGSSSTYVVKIWANIDCSTGLITAPSNYQLITHGSYLKADYVPTNWIVSKDNIPLHLQGIDGKITNIGNTLTTQGTQITQNTSDIGTANTNISTNTTNITNLTNTINGFSMTSDTNNVIFGKNITLGIHGINFSDNLSNTTALTMGAGKLQTNNFLCTNFNCNNMSTSQMADFNSWYASINSTNTTNTSNISTNTSDISTLKTFKGSYTNSDLANAISGTSTNTTNIATINTTLTSFKLSSLSLDTILQYAGTALQIKPSVGNSKLNMYQGSNHTTFEYDGSKLTLDSTFQPNNITTSTLTGGLNAFWIAFNNCAFTQASGILTTTQDFFTIKNATATYSPTLQFNKDGTIKFLQYDGTQLYTNLPLKINGDLLFASNGITSLLTTISNLTNSDSTNATNIATQTTKVSALDWVNVNMSWNSGLNTSNFIASGYIQSTTYKAGSYTAKLPLLFGTTNIVCSDLVQTSLSNGTYNIGLGIGIYGNNTVNSSSQYNVAFGKNNLYKMTSGMDNISIGREALYSLDDCSYNIGIGATCLYNLKIGCNANTFVGVGSGFNYSATGATAIGYNALKNGTGNNYSVYIGYEAQSASNTSQSEIVIGPNITGKGSNIAYIGGSTGIYNQANSPNFAVVSDINQKNIDGPISIGLEQINKLNLVDYHYKTKEQLKQGDQKYYSEDLDSNWQYRGVIAQELQSVFPNSVISTEKGVLGVDWSDIHIANIRAVQELSQQIRDLRSVGNIFMQAGNYTGCLCVCKCKGQIYDINMYNELYSKLGSNMLPNIPDLVMGVSYYIVMK